MPRLRYRCPVCRVIYPSADYVCRGGWPIYDPARPQAVDPPHEPVEVQIDRTDQPDPVAE
jgi:rubredoxin